MPEYVLLRKKTNNNSNNDNKKIEMLTLGSLFFRVIADGESSNETQACHTSVDLPEVGAAEQEHLSSLSIFLILCVLGTVNLWSCFCCIFVYECSVMIHLW